MSSFDRQKTLPTLVVLVFIRKQIHTDAMLTAVIDVSYLPSSSEPVHNKNLQYVLKCQIIWWTIVSIISLLTCYFHVPWATSHGDDPIKSPDIIWRKFKSLQSKIYTFFQKYGLTWLPTTTQHQAQQPPLVGACQQKQLLVLMQEVKSWEMWGNGYFTDMLVASIC